MPAKPSPGATPDLAPLAGAGFKHFFAPLPEPLENFPADLTVTDDFVVRHLGTVMRTKPGETVILTDDARATAYAARIVTVQKKSVAFNVLGQLPAPADLLPHVTLAVALIKEQRWDWLLQKATELGVRAIQPLFSERCMIRLGSADIPKKLERWGGVLRSAAEQSEGLFIPAILPPLPVAQCLQQAPAEALKLLLMERGTNRQSLKTRLTQHDQAQPVILTIGPEGGWSDAEQAAAQSAGFISVSLGQRILRSETAAIAAMAALVAEMDRD